MITFKLKMSSKKNIKRKKILRFSFSLVALFSITSVIVTPLYLRKLSHEKESFTTTERPENSPEIELSSTSASMIVNSTVSMSATSRSSTTTASSSSLESTTKITLKTTTSTRTSSVRTTTTASYTTDTSITSSTTTAPATTTSGSTPPITTKALETLPEFQCETKSNSEMLFDDCLEFCKSVDDKPLQIATEAQAQFMLNYGKVNCPGEKIWMGYRTNNRTHYWIDDELQLTSPVPQWHMSAQKSINCNYFDHNEETSVPYFSVKSDGTVYCKAHKVDNDKHNCLCMSQLPQDFP